MLDGYVSEKEQLESIGKWWNENGKFLLMAIAIGLAIGFGWRYWHTLQMRRAENASVVYQSVLEADSQNNTATVIGGAKLLMNRFSNTPYASLAALLLAKESVAQNNLSLALKNLHWVISNSDQKRLQQIARLSSARILLAEHNPKAAADELSVVDDKHFAPLIAWLKGDIDTQEGNAIGAEAHYTEAKSALAGFHPAMDVLDKKIAQPIIE